MRKKLTSILLIIALVLTSADFTAFAVEDTTVLETPENAENEEAEQTLTANGTEEVLETGTENAVETDRFEGLEEYMDSQTQGESVSENVETAKKETLETEAVSEDISESEIEEAETQVVLDADGNIASGVIDEDYGHITWVIDEDGKLTVTGTGDYAPPFEYIDRAPWYSKRKYITSAVIDVTEMTNASHMFDEYYNMTSVDLSGFDTSNVTNMGGMFEGCDALSSLDLSGFDTSNVTNMGGMFCGCMSLSSLDLSGFDTFNVTDMNCMFADCRALNNLNLSSFDTFSVTSMNSMFEGCGALSSLNLDNFDTSNVTDMEHMFWGCGSLNTLNLNSFDTSKVTSMDGMFWGCGSLNTLNLNSFDTSKVTSMWGMFYGCSSLAALDLSKFNTSNVTFMGGMFYDCNSLDALDLSKFNTSNVVSMNSMFNGCRLLNSLNLSNFDTSNVTDMNYMFAYCCALNNLNLDNFNTYNVVEMYGMFFYCRSLSDLNLKNFNTSNITDMGGMFEGCSSLSSLDLNSFNTSNVTNMGNMFNGCKSLSSLNLNNFDTSNVTSMEDMFWGCSGLTNLDLSNFNTSNVTSMGGMFYGCNSLSSLDLSSFDTSNVTDISLLFYNCTSLSTLYIPYNLKLSVTLPTAESTDKWYRSDGTVVTELPQNLSYSVALGKNHIPKEKDPTPDIEDESIKQLIETEGSIFQFFDDMTGAPIKNERVCIEEEISYDNWHYYTTNNNGYVEVPLSKNCKRVFISTYFKGYKDFGGWVEDISKYRSESGAYRFRIVPKDNKYKPKMPSVKASVDTSAPPVETSDGDISMLNMKMDFDLNFGKGIKSKVTYDKNDRTIKIALSTEKKWLDYDLIKHEFKSTKRKTLNEEWEKALDEMQSGRVSNIDVTFVGTGYLELSESGDFIEGGFTVLLKGQGTTTYRPACTGGVAYAKFQVGLSAEGKLVFTYVDGNIAPSGVAKLELYATIAVGVGWKLAHAEVGATGKIPVKFTFPYKSNKESLSIDAILEIYGETVLFCFGGKKTMSFSRNIYPGTRSAKNGSFNALYSGMSSDDLEILPRNYLSSTKSGIHTYNTQRASGLTSSDSFRYSEVSTDTGVFKENNVQYARLSDGTEILAWIHDFGDKSAVNRTTLVYSVNKNDGNGWSSITPVCSDTATGDYYPNMIAKENKAYLVWNKASKVFDDNVQSDDICKQMDVCVSVFDDGKFSKPQIISDTENEFMEFSPLVAVNGENIAVAWLVNSVNDYHYTKGSNSIYVCEYKNDAWSSPQCYAQNLNYVSDYDMDYVAGQVAILYAEDADNVSDTQDGTAYYVQNGMKTVIGDTSYHAEIVNLCDDMVYFSSDSKVYKASGDKFSSIYDTGVETDNFSVIKSSSGSEAILFYVQDGFARNLYASYFRNGAYTSPVPIVADNSKVTNYASLYNNDGTISIAYDEEELLTDSDNIYGLTDMVVKKNVKPNLFLVGSDLSYDAYNVAPGNTIDFSTTACNYTAHAISQVKLELTGSRSGKVYADTQAVDIPVGEQKSISVSYTLPETIKNEYYTLTVTPVGFDDINLSNNSSKCELGYSDIEIRDLKLEKDTISGTITNIGYQTANNVSLTIREDCEENQPFAVLSYEKGNLAIGEDWTFSQKISPAVFENVGDVQYYLLSASTDSLENNYGNDSATIYSEPVATTGISLDKNTLTLKEKTVATLHAEILPENATFKDARYVSNANDIVAVDNNGNVYALNEGSAVVTAYTLDGSYSASCEITVEGGTEKRYNLSNRGLELMFGDSSRLYAKDESGNNAENVVWSSTDENVVTIAQDGTVQTVGEGIALLVAKIDDFVDVCIVRVSDYFLTVDEEEFTIKLGDKKQLNATISPADGVITYTTENPDIATVSETGLVTGVGIGTTVIHVTAGNFTIDCHVTVTERQGDDNSDENLDDSDVLPEDIPSDGNIPEGLWIAGVSDCSYTGDAIIPTIRVYDNKRLLIEKTDYTLACKNNVNAGKATITVTGKGNYAGKETATFDILPADLSDDNFYAEDFYVKIGNKAQYPVPELYYMGTKLKHKKDFTITYSNTSGVYAKSAEHSATITGTGNYTGTRVLKLTAVKNITKKTSVSITKASVNGFEKAFTYTGKARRQECTLSVKTPEGEKVLTEGIDYTVRYTNNVKAGTVTVTYSGKNGYTGKLKKTYKIAPYNLYNDSETKIVYENFFEYVYAKGGSKPKPVITFDKKVLKEGADYTLSYKNNKEVYGRQMPCVVVNGKGNFTGKLSIYFTINQQDLSKMTLVSCDKVYKEKAGNHKIVPKLMDLDGKLLSAGKDFDKNSIMYTYAEDATLQNGVERKAGDAVEDTDILPADTQIRVTFGCGSGNNYTGTFTGVYRIVRADIKSAKVTIPNQTYTGKAITLDKSQITVTLFGTTLKPEDYEIVQYTDNVKKGKASVTIQGKDNYGGTKTVKFTIGTKGFLWWWRK